MSETCPTFFIQNNTIVEVAYTEWEEIRPGEWGCMESGKIPLPTNVDKVIFELPDGCFQMNTTLYGGNGETVTFGKSQKGGQQVYHCTQKAHFPDENKQTVEKERQKT